MQTALVHDIPETGRILHCGRTTIYELIRSGRLSTIKVGRRTLIPHTALLEFINGASDTPAAS